MVQRPWWNTGCFFVCVLGEWEIHWLMHPHQLVCSSLPEHFLASPNSFQLILQSSAWKPCSLASKPFLLLPLRLMDNSLWSLVLIFIIAPNAISLSWYLMWGVETAHWLVSLYVWAWGVGGKKILLYPWYKNPVPLVTRTRSSTESMRNKHLSSESMIYVSLFSTNCWI